MKDDKLTAEDKAQIARLGLAALDELPAKNKFEQVSEDRYRLTMPLIGLTFEVDRLRRERHELISELCVKCSLPGARTFDGNVSIADFNMSGARARTDRARILSGMSGLPDLDWPGFIEELCQRVLAAERKGKPAVDLREMDKPAADDALHVEGLRLPFRHPAIIFGDGGAAKSYTALYFAGRLAIQGIGVGLFDWELAGEDHRDRLERLFPDMPKVMYVRCERPLIYEVDRLARIVRDHDLQYAFFDSVAFACDGPPESAEAAGKYFRAVRQIGIGSLHVAHVTKGEFGDQKPFGSVFWHNGARATFYVQLAETSQDGNLSIGLFNRKMNLGRLQPAMGFDIAFDGYSTRFTRSDVSKTPDLAVKLTTRQRMAYLLKGGALAAEQIASEIDAKVDTVERTARKYRDVFVLLPGGKVGLSQ